MKRIAVGILALISLIGLAGCELLGGPGDANNNDDPKVILSDWKIKGSFDNWTTHQLTQNAADANKLTFIVEGLYAIDYEFVLMNPAGTEIKYATDDNVTPGTPFDMGGEKNVSFTAAKESYKIEVDVTDATKPKVNLVGGTASALIVTNAVLASKLTIKGDAFSIGWTDTAGTFNEGSSTVSWDVTYNNKNGTFGFSSLDNFLQGVSLDLSALTEGGAGTTPVDLLGNGGNAKLTGAPKADAVYTITVALDGTKALGAGKYTISAKLKTASTTDWKFDVPTSIWFVGRLEGVSGMTEWSQADSGRKEVTVASNKAVLTYTTPATFTYAEAPQQQIKFAKAASSGWNNLIGWAGITADNTGSNVQIAQGGENIVFTAAASTTYTITVDFSGDYPTTGVPSFKVTTP